MDTKSFALELKTLDETGVFEGRLAVYGNVDEAGDVCEPGCFTKTLREGASSVPLLWEHDASTPLGTLQLTDTPTALLAKGRLVMEVPKAREVLALMKAGAVRGMSIGYRVVKQMMAGEVRRLKELRLFEGSLTPLPLNSQAIVTAVKQQQPAEPDLEVLEGFRNCSRGLREFHRALIED